MYGFQLFDPAFYQDWLHRQSKPPLFWGSSKTLSTLSQIIALQLGIHLGQPIEGNSQHQSLARAGLCGSGAKSGDSVCGHRVIRCLHEAMNTLHERLRACRHGNPPCPLSPPSRMIMHIVFVANDSLEGTRLMGIGAICATCAIKAGSSNLVCRALGMSSIGP